MPRHRRSAATELNRLEQLFVWRGAPDFIRSDNGAAFTATVVRDWLARLGVQTLYIAPGSPWENGYVESFNGKLCDELLDREIFYTLPEARGLIARWRREYNTIRPQCAGLSPSHDAAAAIAVIPAG